VFVSDKGRSYKFDSVECMMEALADGGKLMEITVHSSFVLDYAHPGRMVEAGRAQYLVSPNLPSPMGANVTAFAEQTDADNIRTDKGGELLNWEAVQAHLRDWMQS
jgi:copper chaperone NosL